MSVLDKVKILPRRPAQEDKVSEEDKGVEKLDKVEKPTIVIKRRDKKEKSSEELKLNKSTIETVLKPYKFSYDSPPQLINNDLEFVRNLNINSLLSDYLVISIIGPPHTGKSSISSFLGGSSFSNSIFKKREEEKVSEIWMTEQNVVLIEMSSVFNGNSAFELLDFIEKYSTLETTINCWNLKLMRWALSMSHLVIVTNSVFDPDLYQLINTASSISPLENVYGENYPELVFVLNQSEDVSTSTQQNVLSDIFTSSHILGINKSTQLAPNYFNIPNFNSTFQSNCKNENILQDLKRVVENFGRNVRNPFKMGEEEKKKIINFEQWYNLGGDLWDQMKSGDIFSDYIKHTQI